MLIFLQETILSNHGTCNLNVTAVERVMKNFNRTCQTFNAVNSFKYQIQHYMFHDASNSSVLQNLTSIVISLQAISMYLQEIAITEVIIYLRNYTTMHYHKYINDFITGYSVCDVHCYTIFEAL